MKPDRPLLTNEEPSLQYREMSLIDIIKRIVFHCDHQALTEFHANRTLFSYNGSSPMLFIDFLGKLKNATANTHWETGYALEIAEMAYDNTLIKFISLPCHESLPIISGKKNKNLVKRPVTDCRLYFKAFINHVTKLSENNRAHSRFEREYMAASALQGLVRRHFYLSRLEAIRKNNVFWSRYYWDIKGKKIAVWMPKALKGSQRRKWLEKNIPTPNPSAPGERQRIQSIINQELVKEKFVPINKVDQKVDEQQLWSNSDEALGISLAKAVATEKTNNIDKQRRSIKALGKKKLKRLILYIFENIHSGDSNDVKLAKAFGISKATFSRFAGRQWFQSDSNIPDLWLNTAQVLSNHRLFRTVVMETGFWEKIQISLKKGTSRI